MYIRLSDKKYPFTQRAIEALFPAVSFPTPFEADGFAVVFAAPKPALTNLQRADEGEPVEVGDHWEQTWIVVDKFSDILDGPTKAEQEAEYLAELAAKETAIAVVIENKTNLSTDPLITFLKDNTLEEIETYVADQFSALAGMTGTEIDTYIDTNVTDLESVNAVLKVLSRDLAGVINILKVDTKIAVYLIKKELG